MAELNETPRGNRVHIAFFGLRNAGKSTLVNAFTGQSLAIVSEVPGTTTDPVSKAMEILPLGPCLVTDTAGLDDVGELGRQRVRKTLGVLETTDIAVWVHGDEVGGRGTDVKQMSDRPLPDLRPLTGDLLQKFLSECTRRHVVLLEYHRGDSVEELKRKIAAVTLEEKTPGLLDGLVAAGDRVVCVVPIDESAPKGRLILPQQQVIRACLDRHVPCSVCQPEELFDCLGVGLFDLRGRLLVITDSQAFGSVSKTIERFEQSNNPTITLTSFSILFARQKGDLAEYARGIVALRKLKDGDTVLVAEGCTHHRQCNDIGSVKIPKALGKLTGKKLNFVFTSGSDFDLKGQGPEVGVSLVVHCGGCMLTRREVLRRIGRARDAGVPIVNYGMVLAAADGLPLEDILA